MQRLALCLALCLAYALFAGCHSESLPDSSGAPLDLAAVDLKPGDGAAITAGEMAVVQYTGWLYDAAAPDHKGRQFDTSRKPGDSPFRFRLGAGEVIPGWDRGIAGMKVRGQRRLTIPPELAYGDRGAGFVIPPRATLVFDVELLGAEPAAR